MNKKFIRVAVILVSAAAIFTGGCHKKSENSEKTKATTVAPSSEANPLVVDIPEPRTDGTLTIKDSEGNVYFQYAGVIDIKNNGKNGEEIDIEVTLPSEKIQSADTSYSSTLPVVLYDKDTQSIQQYMTHPEYEHGVLKLKDAKQTYLERDIEWEDTY